MLVGSVRIELIAVSGDKPFVTIDSINREPHSFYVTDTEIECCPAKFRCFSCQRVFPREQYAGEVGGERLCVFCRPWLDAWDIGRALYLEARSKPKWSKDTKPSTPHKARALEGDEVDIERWLDKAMKSGYADNLKLYFRLWMEGKHLPPEKFDEIREIVSRLAKLISSTKGLIPDKPLSTPDPNPPINIGLPRHYHLVECYLCALSGWCKPPNEHVPYCWGFGEINQRKFFGFPHECTKYVPWKGGE